KGAAGPWFWPGGYRHSPSAPVVLASRPASVARAGSPKGLTSASEGGGMAASKTYSRPVPWRRLSRRPCRHSCRHSFRGHVAVERVFMHFGGLQAHGGQAREACRAAI